jgi:hypothetical protein
MRWTPAQVLVASLICGGPLAGFLLLALQARTAAGTPPMRLRPWAWVAAGVLGQLAIVLLAVLAPDGFPRGGVAAASIALPWAFARQIHAAVGVAPGSSGSGVPLGWTRVLGLGMACLFVTVVTGLMLSVVVGVVTMARSR